MITSPQGAERVQVLTGGPQHETMAVAQFRDAAGYSKQSPLPPRKVTLPGVVKLAGTTVAIETTGIINGNQISGLGNTDGLVNAVVVADGLPEGTTVLSIARPALPGLPGAVVLSNPRSAVGATGLAQPVTFTLTVERSSISGLTATDGLDGAAVSGSGIPDGTTVSTVNRAAVAPTNTQQGTPGEVLILLPPPPPPPPAPTPVAAPPAAAPAMGAPAPAPTVAAAPAPTVAPPPVAAVLTPVDVTFDIPVAPIVVPDGVSRLILSPTEALPALTVTTPPKPVDGQELFIFCTKEVGALTVLANVGQSINLVDADVAPTTTEPVEGAPAPVPANKLIANGSIGFLYSAPNATWDRIE